VHELLAAVDRPGALGAVRESATGNRADVLLVVLAEVRREPVRDPALLADPGDRRGGVEAAREGDPDALADRQGGEDA